MAEATSGATSTVELLGYYQTIYAQKYPELPGLAEKNVCLDSSPSQGLSVTFRPVSFFRASGTCPCRLPKLGRLILKAHRAFLAPRHCSSLEPKWLRSNCLPPYRVGLYYDVVPQNLYLADILRCPNGYFLIFSGGYI